MMKKRTLALLSIIPFLFACNEKEPVEPESDKYIVDFSTAATGFNNDNKDSFANRMKTLVNSEKELISSVDSLGYVQVSQLDMLEVEAPYSEYVLHALISSSNSQDGSVTFHFTSTLKTVKVYAQPYFKTYHHYGDPSEPEIAVSSDETNKIKVNNMEWNLTQQKGPFEVPDKVEREFTINSDYLTINGYSGQRVFIHKLEFTIAK